MRNAYLDTFEFPFSKEHNSEWMKRHVDAVHNPRAGFEHALVSMFSGWLRYADEHRRRYGSGIGDDGVLGHEWSKIGGALRGLLNGETGRFDCGTLDALISNTLCAEGINPDEL